MNEMRAALLRARDAWNRGDLDGYLELYHPEIKLHGYTPEAMSKSEVRGFYLDFFAAFPDVQLHFDELITEGSTLMVRYHCDCVHKGPFMGAPATGRAARIAGHTSMHFRGAQVIER